MEGPKGRESAEKAERGMTGAEGRAWPRREQPGAAGSECNSNHHKPRGARGRGDQEEAAPKKARRRSPRRAGVQEGSEGRQSSGGAAQARGPKTVQKGHAGRRNNGKVRGSGAPKSAEERLAEPTAAEGVESGRLRPVNRKKRETRAGA